MNRSTKLLGVLLLLAVAATSQTVAAADDSKPASRPAPAANNIDLVICLDVSNSMDGLIGSAKAKLWDIVNELARIKPAPNLRVALYSYGNDGYDRNVGWVKKDLDLTGDLDLLYQKLFALTTRGGTEYVTRVCRDAVRDLNWSGDKNALKIIFVCGNEPASQDPVVKLKEAADYAIAKGVIVNPIYCGNSDDADARDWRQFAALAGGRFASIDQSRATIAIATPMDKKLAELGVQLNRTYVAYGKAWEAKSKNQSAQTVNAFSAGAGVAASRTAAQNSPIYQCQDWDLVDRCKMDKQFDVTKVPDSELCDAMKKLTPAQRVAYVKDMTAKRAALQKQISELDARRVLFINEAMRRNPNAANRAFDVAIRATLREQAVGRGIIIPKE
jgi:hypothetical protein